jgi:urease accessory protein
MAAWRAQLDLVFAQQNSRTVLRHRQHCGPLQIQRPFYPETDGTIHLYLLHPPGGVAGGDELHINLILQENSRALLTTPAATKLYRHPVLSSHQCLQANLGDQAMLEWLPQETIAFNNCRTLNELQFNLGKNSVLIAWDNLCLARPAINERFTEGRIEQRIRVNHLGQALWRERSCLQGQDEVLQSRWGWQGQPVLSSFFCGIVEQSLLSAAREQIATLSQSDQEHIALTWFDGLLVGRYLGGDTRRAQAYWLLIWSLVRARLWGKTACLPRIWAT